jgi:hypothetical protein
VQEDSKVKNINPITAGVSGYSTIQFLGILQVENMRGVENQGSQLSVRAEKPHSKNQ